MRYFLLTLTLALAACQAQPANSPYAGSPLSAVSAGYRSGGLFGAIGAAMGETPPAPQFIPPPAPRPPLMPLPQIQPMQLQPVQPMNTDFGLTTCSRNGQLVTCNSL